MFRTLTAAFVSVAVAASAAALPIRDIDPGDSYYLSLLGENELVSVSRVDRANNRVKIRRQSGYTEWVSPSRLLTYGKSFEEDAATVAVGAVLLACLFMPDECTGGGQSSSTTRNTTSTSYSGSTRKRIAIENKCREEVKVRVLREDYAKWQNATDWSWTIPAYQTYNLSLEDNSKPVMSDHSTIYINATSRSFVWDGSEEYTYGSGKQKFRKASVTDDGNRYRIVMTCNAT
jgi:hypothetical protein